MARKEKEEIDNTVYVGSKDAKTYVFAVTTQANMNNQIFIKARGRSISRAVDVSQISINRFLKDWKIKEVKIGTEERPITNEHDDSGKELQKVSFIEIEIIKE